MLDPTLPIALFAEATLGTLNAKMTEGILRYGRNPVAAVIDSTKAGRQVSDVCAVPANTPVVASLDEAIARGAAVLVLGTAPSGGRLPPDWIGMLEQALDRGLHLINGMHDRLEPLLGHRLREGQWIWDLRVPQGDPPPIAMARAAALDNRRVLMVGTDMAIGKMTAGLELTRGLQDLGHDAAFLATGQIGIAITGRGIPLDAMLVDHAAGAVERMVLEAANHPVVVVEGQGSLLHPGSTATLPLLRGSCCNAMVLCHRAGMRHLDTIGEVLVPPLPDVIALYEAVASAAGALPAARIKAIAVDTSRLDATAAGACLRKIEDQTGLPAVDPVRDGRQRLATAVLD